MLRPATDADRDLVLAWRNHDDVRAASLTRHVIRPEEHAAWWARATQDPARRILVYERGGIPSGLVMFFDHDREERSAWWSFYLDVDGLEQRGELLLAWIEAEREAVRYAFDDLGLEVLHGEVLASNEAVRSLHRRFRMREVDTYDRDVDGTPEQVVRVEARAAEVRR